MLQPSTKFDVNERFAMLIRGWIALDPESGAHLSGSRGHSKSGNAPKYFLILPNKSIEERGGLFASYDWDYSKGRKVFRAWTESEAIEIANRKLAEMLKQAEI